MADSGEELSDDEIFFGKMTLKEVKKHIWLNHDHNKTSNRKPSRNSIKIIETHSQPDLRSISVNSPSPPGSARDNRKSDESFIQMENLVSKMCLSPEKAAELELNNTLEIVEFILNNGPNQVLKQDDKNVRTEHDVKTDTPKIKTEKKIEIENKGTEDQLPKTCSKKVLIPAKNSTPKTKVKAAVKSSPKYCTPGKSPRKQDDDVFLTPSSNMLQAKTVFKTPANPLALKKSSAASLKNFTPSKSPMYRHIKSPIATYIKGSVEVPMVTNVCPKKPLPGGSMIPKFVKKEAQIKQNKENVNLPTSAYKSAKKTKVVAVPEEKPKSQVAKKLLSALSQPPVVLKHETREFKSERKPLLHLQEDSIADQSCLQADLSVCTQVKPANK